MMTVYWQPFDNLPPSESNRLRRQIDEIFDKTSDHNSDPTTGNQKTGNQKTENLVGENLVGEGATGESLTGKGSPAALKSTWLPTAELVDTPDAFQLRVLLPGISDNSLDVQATRTSVTVAGDRPSLQLDEQHSLIGSEFAYGPFQRVFSLPVEVHPDQIQADFQHGVLSLRLPKADVYHKVTVQRDRSA